MAHTEHQTKRFRRIQLRDHDTVAALARMAQMDRRTPAAQLAYLVEEAAAEKGIATEFFTRNGRRVDPAAVAASAAVASTLPEVQRAGERAAEGAEGGAG